MPRTLNLSYKKHSRARGKQLQQDVDQEKHAGSTSCVTESTQTEPVPVFDAATQAPDDLQSTCHPNILTPLPFSAAISLDIDLFYSLNCESANQLQRRLESMKFVYGDWVLIPTTLQAEKLQIVRLGQQQPQCSLTLEVLSDLSWLLQLPSGQISPSTSPVLEQLPQHITSVSNLRTILSFMDGCSICEGNPDPKFAPIVARNKGIFKDRNGKFTSHLIYL